MPPRDLPPEIIDLILLQTPPPLLPLRLTSHAVNKTLTPRIFHTLSLTRGANPALRLAQLLDLSPHLAPLVKDLRLTLTAAPNIEPGRQPTTPASYFKWVGFILPSVLTRLVNLETLSVHAEPGIPGLRGNVYVGWDYRSGNFLHQCLLVLADGVGSARLGKLEKVTLGMPYSGGYGDFFGREGKMGIAKRVGDGCEVFVKLFNEVGDFTVMPVL